MIFPISNNSQVTPSGFNVCLLLGGSITIQHGMASFAIPARNFFFFDKSFDIIAASPFLEGFVLKLDEEFLKNYPELEALLTVARTPFELIPLRQIDAKRNLMSALLAAQGHLRLMESYLHIGWTELLRDQAHAQSELSTVARFSELIDQHIEQNYCAGTYAEMMGIPLKKLIREVRKEEQKTPCNFITQKVITKAKEKLMHTDDTSQMIAYQLGFEDPYYFIKYFKKNTDMTPTQFRESLVNQD